MTAPSVPSMLTPLEAAQRLGLSERTFRRYMADGDVPAYKIGRQNVRVKAEDVDALIVLVAPSEVENLG